MRAAPVEVTANASDGGRLRNGGRLRGHDVDGLPTAFGAELHLARDQREQGVVATPSRWALESRPLRELDAPFLCAMTASFYVVSLDQPAVFTAMPVTRTLVNG